MSANHDHSAGSELPLWEQVFVSRSWGRYPSEALVRFVGRSFGRISDRRALRILEVGCGPGPNLWFLVREGFTVAGIDGSPTAIQQAGDRLRAERLPDQLPQVDLRVGNFIALPWSDGEFDAVCDIEAIYANSMTVIRATIGEIYRVLKPGGRFFGQMFGSRTTGSASGIALEPQTSVNPQTGPCAGFGTSHFFTESELRDLFSGFSELKLDWNHRTDQAGAVEICEWLVTATK